jgi:ribosomal protein L31
LDTTTLKDGNYAIRFFANDTVNNVNNTEFVNITIDNTPPSISDCQVDNVDLAKDEVASLACVVTDAYSGVSAVVFSSNHTCAYNSENLLSGDFVDGAPACADDGSTMKDDSVYRNITNNVFVTYDFTLANDSAERIVFRTNSWRNETAANFRLRAYNFSLGDWYPDSGYTIIIATSDDSCSSWGSGSCYEWTICSSIDECAHFIDTNRVQINYWASGPGNVQLSIDQHYVFVNTTVQQNGDDWWNTTYACRSSGNMTWMDTFSSDVLNQMQYQSVGLDIYCDANPPYFAADNSTNSTLSNTLIKLNQTVLDDKTGVHTVIYTINNANYTAAYSGSESYYEVDCTSFGDDNYVWNQTWANDTAGNDLNMTGFYTKFTCDLTQPVILSDNSTNSTVAPIALKINQTVTDNLSNVTVLYTIMNTTDTWNETADWNYQTGESWYMFDCVPRPSGYYNWSGTWVIDDAGNGWNYTDVWTTWRCAADNEMPQFESCQVQDWNLYRNESTIVACNITDQTGVGTVYAAIGELCGVDDEVSGTFTGNPKCHAVNGTTTFDDGTTMDAVGSPARIEFNFTVSNRSAVSSMALRINAIRSHTDAGSSLTNLVWNYTSDSWVSMPGLTLGLTDQACASWGTDPCFENMVCDYGEECDDLIDDTSTVRIRYQIDTLSYYMNLDYHELLVNYTAQMDGVGTAAWWNFTYTCKNSGNVTWAYMWANDTKGNGWNFTEPGFEISCDMDLPQFVNPVTRDTNNATHTSFYIGDTVRLTTNVTDDTQNLDGVFVTLRDPGSNALVSNATMINVSGYPTFEYYYDWDSGLIGNGTYTVELWADDSSEQFNMTSFTFDLNNETFDVLISTDDDAIGKTHTATVQCSPRCIGTFCNDTNVYLEWNDTGAWEDVPTSGAGLTANTTSYDCGDFNDGEWCNRTWLVTGNAEDEYYLRCNATSVTALDNVSAMQPQSVNLGYITVDIDVPSTSPYEIGKTAEFTINITTTCHDFYCGAVNITTLVSSTPVANPTIQIDGGTEIRRESGDQNPRECPVLDAEATPTCTQSFNASSQFLTTKTGANRIIGANITSNETNVADNVTWTNNTIKSYVGWLEIQIDYPATQLDATINQTLFWTNISALCHDFYCGTPTMWLLTNESGSMPTDPVTDTSGVKRESGDTNPNTCGSALYPGGSGNTAACYLNITGNMTFEGMKTLGANVSSSDSDVNTNVTYDNSSIFGRNTGVETNLDLSATQIGKTHTAIMGCGAICRQQCDDTYLMAEYNNGTGWAPIPTGVLDLTTNDTFLSCGDLGDTEYCNQTWLLNGNLSDNYQVRCFANSTTAFNPTPATSSFDVEVGWFEVFVEKPASDIDVNKTDSVTVNITTVCHDWYCGLVNVSALVNDSGLEPVDVIFDSTSLQWSSGNDNPYECTGVFDPDGIGNTQNCTMEFVADMTVNGLREIAGLAESNDSQIPASYSTTTLCPLTSPVPTTGAGM